jgi:membrane protease YdiL (CAAX protease family)
MEASSPNPRRQVATFLGLTFALSTVCYWIIISAGTLAVHGGLIVLALMWSPGLSALATRLLYQGNVRGQGWRWGASRYELLAYVLPLGYGIAAYGAVWVFGLGRLDLSRFHSNVAVFLFGGMLQSVIFALGEELGWRGFLVPKLAEFSSLRR